MDLNHSPHHLSSSLRLCPDCSASYIDYSLRVGEELLCTRCGKKLKKYGDRNSLQRIWALVTASLIFLMMANVSPLMVFDVSGNAQSNLMITGVESLFFQGYWPLALLVFFLAIALPTLYFTAFWYLLGGCCLRRPWPCLKGALFLVEILMPWNLIPVFAVAILAAVVKLQQLGNIQWKSGSLWVALLAIVSLMIMRFFDRSFFEEIIAGIEKSR